MIKKHSVNADIRQWNTEGAAEPVKSPNANVSGSKKQPPDRAARYPTFNIYSVIVECPTNSCEFITTVYGQADLEMWKSEGLMFPECPMCGNILRRARRQYRILE